MIWIWVISMVVIGLVIGWLMGLLTEGSGLGPLGSTIVGIVGSLLGGFLFATFGVRLLGLGYAYFLLLFASMVGAVVALVLARLLRSVTP